MYNRFANFSRIAAFVAFSCAIATATAADIAANPTNYRSLLANMRPGDTLVLAEGTYGSGLPISGKYGTSMKPITVRGPADKSAVFKANDCCNTVQLERVSDGQAVRALPAFSFKVSATSNVHSGGGGGGGTDNRAPTISGTPAAKTTVGQPFVFRPQSADANGDKLTFSILNKPEWAQLSAIDGVLTGTPATDDVRSYGNIVIRVSDGKATTTLKPFAVTVVAADTATRSVTLNWSAPTRNTDGSALTDLSGYRVFYGTDSREYSSSVAVPGVAASSVELEGLTAGTWYFAIKSINRVGVESDFSGEVRAKLQG